MHYTKIFTIVTLFAASAFAAPAAEAEPNEKPSKPNKPKPPPPTGPNQSNSCGNGGSPYCCNTDNYGFYTKCSVLGSGSQCSATTVCCNADHSVQICLGNAVVL